MTYAAPDVVAHDIALHCDDEFGRPMAFMATFGYDAQDPFAVRITFHLPSGEVPWLVSRALLDVGWEEPAGDGDIRLRPRVDDDGRAVTQLVFCSAAGCLRADVRSAELRAFLRHTETLVPIGDEHLDLDELVAALTGSSA